PRACHEASRRARSLLQDGRQMTVARAKMRVAQWARLHTPARCGLRWGAWYPVMALTPREAQLWVRWRAVVVARSLLALRSTPPRPRAPRRRASLAPRRRARRTPPVGAPCGDIPAPRVGPTRYARPPAQRHELVT